MRQRLKAVYTATFLLLAAVSAFVAYWVATEEWAKRGDVSQFYQQRYAPAVMFACTGELFAIRGDLPAPLVEFLSRKRQTLECSEIIPLPEGVVRREFSPFDQQSLGSYYQFGWLWKLFGIDWGVAKWVAVGFSLMTVVGLTLLGGLLVPRPVALIIATLIVYFDEPSRYQMVHLRDYSKAPLFFLTVWAFATYFTVSGKQKLWWAGISAFLLAMALGFRQDVAPLLYIASLGFFLRLVFDSDRKGTALSMLAFGGVLIAFPYLLFNFWEAIGWNVYHFYFLGQTPRFLSRFMGEYGGWILGYRYNDEMTKDILSLFEVVNGRPEVIIGGPGYEAAGRGAFILTTLQFPADALAKSISAFPLAIFGWVKTGVSIQLALTAAVCAVILFTTRLRGLVVLFPIAFFAAITFVQYDIRHVFPYQMLGKMLLAVSALLLIVWVWSAFQGRGDGQTTSRLRYAALPFAVLLLIAALLPLLRVWQARNVTEILAMLDRAPSERMLDAGTPGMDGGLALPLDVGDGKSYKYARINLNREGPCRAAPVLTPIYEAAQKYYDWSEPIAFFPLGVTAIYLPLIQDERNEFRGFTLNGEAAQCFSSIDEITLPANIYPAIYWKSAEAFPYYRTRYEE